MHRGCEIPNPNADHSINQCPDVDGDEHSTLARKKLVMMYILTLNHIVFILMRFEWNVSAGQASQLRIKPYVENP